MRLEGAATTKAAEYPLQPCTEFARISVEHATMARSTVFSVRGPLRNLPNLES